jgi:uncharacterized membrane protein
VFPEQVYRLTGVSVIATYLASINHLQATLVFTVIAIIVIGGIISVVYGYMYEMLAPSQYGPTDVPPPRVKTKKYKR